jgi:hypothetical protein
MEVLSMRKTSLLARAQLATALSPLGSFFKGVDVALRSSLIAALTVSPIAASAQEAVITPLADPSGGSSPRMDMAANGTPVVKIATPANGTSYNRYDARRLY